MTPTPDAEALSAVLIEVALAAHRANHLGHDVHRARLKEGLHWLQDIEREQRHLDHVAPLPAGAGLGFRSEDGSP